MAMHGAPRWKRRGVLGMRHWREQRVMLGAAALQFYFSLEHRLFLV